MIRDARSFGEDHKEECLPIYPPIKPGLAFQMTWQQYYFERYAQAATGLVPYEVAGSMSTHQQKNRRKAVNQ